jgi:hypothetical protein
LSTDSLAELQVTSKWQKVSHEINMRFV